MKMLDTDRELLAEGYYDAHEQYCLLTTTELKRAQVRERADMKRGVAKNPGNRNYYVGRLSAVTSLICQRAREKRGS